MNKKIIITTSLALALAITNIGQVRADDLDDEKNEELIDEKEEKVKESYIIKEIKDDYIILNKKAYKYDLYQVEKNKFNNINLEPGKEVNITSDRTILKSYPAQFGKIYEIKEVKTEDEKIPEEKISDEFVVKEVNEEGVTVEKVGSLSEKYIVEKKYFDDDVKEGNKYKITHNDIVMNSYPAQFNKIYGLEKLEKESPKNASITNVYKVKAVNDNNVTLAYYSKEDGADLIEDSKDMYTLAKKEFKDEVKVGDKYKITHSDEILTSNPAQFVKVTKIEKILDTNAKANNKDKENKDKDNYMKATEKKDADKDNKLTNKNSLNKNSKDVNGVKDKVAGKNPKTGIISSTGLVTIPFLSAAAFYKSKKY